MKLDKQCSEVICCWPNSKFFREISFFSVFFYEPLAFFCCCSPLLSNKYLLFLVTNQTKLFFKHESKELCLALNIKICYWIHKNPGLSEKWKIWLKFNGIRDKAFWRESITLAIIYLLKQNINPWLFLSLFARNLL